MTKSRIILTAALLFISLVGSQPVFGLTLSFQQTWGGVDFDRAEGVAVGPDGSVYLAGTTSSFGAGDGDAFLLKFAPDGTLAWQRTYGTGRVQPDLNASEFASGVAVGSDGSAYVAGDSADGHAFLVKFAPDGTLVWQRNWGGSGTDFALGVAVASDDSIYLTGFTNSFGAGSNDALLLKFAPDGTLLWERTWGGANDELAHGVAVGPDGSVYVAGETNSFFGNDAFLLKFAPSGTLVWQQDWKTGGIRDISVATAVAIGPDAGVYITGLASISGVGQDIFVAKFTSDGGLIWQKTWGAQTDAALGVATASDGSVYVTGNTGFGAGGGDAFVVQFTSTGKAKSAATWGGVDNESAQSIAVAPDGSIYVAAVASAPPYAFDRASKMAKTPKGSLNTPTGTVTSPVGNVTTPNGVVTTPDGSFSFAGATDAALIKVVR